MTARALAGPGAVIRRSPARCIFLVTFLVTLRMWACRPPASSRGLVSRFTARSTVYRGDPNAVTPNPRDKKLRHLLHHRFRVVWDRHYRARKFRIFCRSFLVIVIPLAVIGGLVLGWSSMSPWPLISTLKHLASFPNCDTARALGLAFARKGEPGYWLRHDQDGDGITCNHN